MTSRKEVGFINPVQLCGLIVFIMSAPKVLTETNCECLVLSKHSGGEWIDDCADTTTDFTSTTFTITTPGDVADPGKQTEKPVVLSSPDSKPKTNALTKSNALTTKVPTSKPTIKEPASRLTTTLLTTKLVTLKTTVRATVGKPVSGVTTIATAKSSTKSPILKPTAEGESETQPVSESGVDGTTVGGAVGAVVGVAAIISAVVLFWKLGVLKRCHGHHLCRSSKVRAYDAENVEVSQNGTKPGEKTLKAS